MEQTGGSLIYYRLDILKAKIHKIDNNIIKNNKLLE